MMKTLFKLFVLALSLFGVFSAIGNNAQVLLGATPVYQVQQGGTGWGNIQSGTYLTGNGTGKLSTSTCEDITGSADLCDGNDATGAAATFPFTSVSGYNSTSTTLAFLNGFFSTASSTQSGDFYLSALSQGFAYLGSGGKANTIASSSINLSWFNNDSGFSVFPFTSVAGYNSTSTTIGFLNGLFSTASSTFSSAFRLPTLSAGGLGVDVAGLVYSGATTTAGAGLTYSGNAFNVNTSQNIATLSNLTDNGFVKTGSGNGTLSVDTTTYESGLTAGDGLTRTVNDFDCDTASGSVFGCLASADWTTFNNKLSTIGSGSIGSLAAWSAANTLIGTGTPQLTVGNILATSTTATSTFLGNFIVGSSTPMTGTKRPFVTIGTSTDTYIHIGQDGKMGILGINNNAGRLSFGSGDNANVNPNVFGLFQDATDARFGASVNSSGVFMKSSGGVYAYNYTAGAPKTLTLQEFAGTSATVGIGSTTPFGKFAIESQAGINAFAIGSSTATYLIVDKNGALKLTGNSLTGRIQPFYTMTGGHATSSWSGTTTQLLAPAVANVTLRGAYCETDVGTVGVSVYDGTNRATYIPTASTTINYFEFSTNNTFTTGESIRVDFGTPASSPKQAVCRFKFTYDD